MIVIGTKCQLEETVTQELTAAYVGSGALPVFGTGTILIPWALVLFLRGQTKTGVGLVVLYGAAALSRQALEPRLVGKQVGLNPVLTLLALYTGYRLLGVGGMIVFPITAMLLKQIWDHSGLQPEG